MSEYGRQQSLLKAFANRDDEFYTRYEDIEKELSHYSAFLKDKIIYCNCDNPFKSNFITYFKDNFERLHLKKLIATCYNGLEQYTQLSLFEEIKEKDTAYYYEYDGKKENVSYLKQNGDFKSEECLKILDVCDIVITNPPYSKIRSFIDTILEHKKDFVILGSLMLIIYEDYFKYFKSGKIRLGFNKPYKFFYENQERNISSYWYTTLPIEVNRPFIKLTKTYNPTDYPKYDNVDAIEVSHYKDIPYDYKGYMGVPINFLEHFNPNQFELVGLLHTREENAGIPIKKYDDSEWTERYSNGTKTNRLVSRHPASPVISVKGDIDGVYNHNEITGENTKVLYCRFIIKNKF